MFKSTMTIVAIAVGIVVAIVVLIVASLKQSSKKGVLRRSETAEAKGARGERLVAKILGDTVKGEQYVINDALFVTKDGDSCQIDHILINRHGVFVIETKNKCGKIYGYPEQRKWKQYLSNGQKFDFENPIKQNETHIIKLSRATGVKNVFINVVVFLDEADISALNASEVYPISRLKEIKTNCTEVSLTVDEMEKFYDAITKLVAECPITMSEHINNVQAKHDALKSGLCPRCGKPLKLRSGPYGEFYACSGYPNCKFTINEKDLTEV